MSAPEKPAIAAGTAPGDAVVAKEAPQANSAPEEKKVSGAELKKRAKEEKAARRAQAQQEKFGGAAPPPGRPDAASAVKLQQKGQQQKGKDAGKDQHKRSGSSAPDSKQLPIRGQQYGTTPAPPPEEKKENKNVRLFGHLYSRTRTTSLAGISKEVHPAVQATGLQMSNYEICGSNARFVATLESFKRAS